MPVILKEDLTFAWCLAVYLVTVYLLTKVHSIQQYLVSFNAGPSFTFYLSRHHRNDSCSHSLYFLPFFFSCLCCPSAGCKGVCHSTWLSLLCFGSSFNCLKPVIPPLTPPVGRDGVQKLTQDRQVLYIELHSSLVFHIDVATLKH